MVVGMVVGMVVDMGRHMLFALPLIWDMRYALLYPVCHYLYPLNAPHVGVVSGCSPNGLDLGNLAEI